MAKFRVALVAMARVAAVVPASPAAPSKPLELNKVGFKLESAVAGDGVADLVDPTKRQQIRR